MSTPLATITGIGARSGLGLDALTVAMCTRACKLEPRPTDHCDKAGHRIGVVRALALRDDLHGFERLVALAAAPLSEAARPLRSGTAPPLVLALPEPGRPDDDARLGAEAIEALARRSEVAIDAARSEVVRAGHAGFALALERALALLAGGDAPAVIVGGADSYYNPDVLAWLDRECRLHAPDTDNGLIPGEGAAFVLLERYDPRRERERPGLAHLAAVATAREESLASGEPNAALAMTRLVRAIAGASSHGALGWVIQDDNGERHRQTEWTRVRIRSHDLLTADVRFSSWASEMGDVGAASGALFTTTACAFFQARCAPAPGALVALHAEGPERGAFLIEDAS